jgi:hypothetical protein
VNLRAGQTVYLLADGGLGGRVRLRAEAVPVDPATNDAYADASGIGQSKLPFDENVDVGRATSERRDPDCLDAHATVWYAFTPASTILAEVSTAGSSYDSVVSVLEVTEDGLRFIACRDDDLPPDPTTASWRPAELVRFTARAGHTYRIVVGSVGEPSLLHLSISEHVLVRIDPTGRLTDEGAAVIHGTVRCSHRLDGIRTTAARQILASGAIRKGVSQDLDGCVAGEQGFRTTVFPSAGVFHRGPISIDMEWQFGERGGFGGDYAVTERSARVVLE